MIEVGTAAHVYGIPAPTIRRWIAEGRLVRYGTARRAYVDPAELDQLHDRRTDAGHARRARRVA